MAMRFFELLNLLSEHTTAEEAWEVVDEDFIELLESQGFSRIEINLAMQLAQRLRDKQESISSRCLPVVSHKTLSYIEQHRLTPPAKSVLEQLLALGLILPQDYENVLEETLMLDEPEIDEEAVRALVRFYLCTKGTRCPSRWQILDFLSAEIEH